MSEMHLRQPTFTHSPYGSNTKSKQRIQKFQETGDWRYISQNQLDKVCFQHEMGHRAFKLLSFLSRKTASDKSLLDEAFDIA